MTKLKIKQADLRRPDIQEIPEEFLEEFIGTLDNVTSTYTLLKGLFELNQEPIENLLEIQKELVEYFGHYSCPVGNDGCPESEMTHDLFADRGMVSFNNSGFSNQPEVPPEVSLYKLFIMTRVLQAGK